MFKFAGVSRRGGQYRVRFASDALRVKHLARTGNDDIAMIEMPVECERHEAVSVLMKSELMSRPEYREAILQANYRYNPPMRRQEILGVPVLVPATDEVAVKIRLEVDE